ncbi:MAG TPA: hypothetical protein VFE08_15415 [Candidatus Sulfotelmatobacter sp.]|nr:hypothetical protein [Candidatus Sulfotelmatobacter sp.]
MPTVQRVAERFTVSVTAPTDYLYTAPPVVLTCPFDGVGDATGAVVVAVVPWF